MQLNWPSVPRRTQAISCWCTGLLLLIAVVSPRGPGQAAEQLKRAGAEPVPKPAMSAILAAWEKYEVVGMPEGHGMKDLDDFILLLVRNPAFPQKANDIAVECGNSL